MARPTYVLEAAFTSSPDDPVSAQVWTDISAYLDVSAGVKITRGKTDELGAVQPSTFSGTLKNSDGRFTPNLSTSPYYPNVKVGKYVRLGLMWPGGGKNYAPNVTTANDLTGWSGTGTVPPTLTMSTTGPPPVGTHGLQISWGVGGTLPAASMTLVGLVIGKTYTVSANARVPSAGSGPAILLGISGILDGSPTTLLDTWQQIKVTFTATANTHLLRVRPASSPTGGTGRLNALQVEEGSTPSAFVNTAGTFAWRFTGKSVEWPLAWEGGPAYYAETKLSAVDVLAKLAGEDARFQDLIVEDVLDDHPFAFYPLTEDSGSLTAGDVSGNAQGALSSTTAGTPGTSAIVFGQKYTAATSATVAVERVPSFYRDTRSAAGFFPVDENDGKYLTGQLAAPVSSATGSTIVAYARADGTLTTGPVAILMAANGSWFGLDKRAAGGYTARFFDAPSNTLSEYASAVGPGSTIPSQLVAVLDVPGAGLGRVTFYLDGTAQGSSANFPMAAVPSWVRVHIGGRPKVTFRGDISHVSFYDYPLPTGSIVAQWYSAFRGMDGTGDTSSTRIIKLRGFASLDFPTIAGSGPQSLGPQEVAGAPLDAIARVEASEDGLFFIAGSGAPSFRLRNFRINRAPDATIAADMIDAGSVGFRGDNYGLTNDVVGSRANGATARIVNQASVADHGRVKATLDTVLNDDTALRARTAWQANVDGIQRNRVTGLRVSLLNFPSVIAAMLVLDLWHKIRVTTLPTTQAPAAQLDLTVEGWTEVISETEWSMSFTTSPGDRIDTWLIGVAGHNEIGLTTRIGY